MASLVARSVNGAMLPTVCASSSARANKAPSSCRISLIRPIFSASSASISRAKKIISRTRPDPISSLKRAKFFAARQFPSVRAIGNPNLRVSEAILISQAAAIDAPPPVQAPFMAAITGTGHCSIALKTRSI